MSNHDQNIDPESARLLAELEAQTSQPAAQPEQPAAKGKRGGRGNNRANAVAPVAEESAAPVVVGEQPSVTVITDPRTVRNISNNPHAVGATVIAPGKSYTLTAHDLANNRIMMRIRHAVTLGLLHVVD